MLTQSLDTLNRTAPPPVGQRFLTYKDASRRIGTLEKELGLPKGEAIFNIGAANARIRELESVLANRPASTATPAPAATTAVPAPVATASNVKTASQYLALGAADRQQFARDGGKLSHAEFNTLPVSAKMAFCTNGGQLCNLELNGNTRTQGGLPK
jgi:hypothetical protein